jgi:hypothetical protein
MGASMVGIVKAKTAAKPDVENHRLSILRGAMNLWSVTLLTVQASRRIRE